MDINIEAKDHPNQEQLIEYYENKLRRKYGKYEFAKKLHVKVKDLGKDGYEVALSLLPEGGATLFASSKHQSENSALLATMRKLKSQIEKYRVQRYNSL